MNVARIIIKVATGEPLRQIMVDESMLAANVGTGEAAISEPMPAGFSAWWNTALQVWADKPAKPSEYASWDANAKAWADARPAENAWNDFRALRSRLLAESDYVVLKAYEAGEAVPSSWANYRQSLRDIPQTQTDPFHIELPEAPAP